MNWRDQLTPEEAARLDELYAARLANQAEINRIAKRCRKRMERRYRAINETEHDDDTR